MALKITDREVDGVSVVAASCSARKAMLYVRN